MGLSPSTIYFTRVMVGNQFLSMSIIFDWSFLNLVIRIYGFSLHLQIYIVLGILDRISFLLDEMITFQFLFSKWDFLASRILIQC